MGLDHTHVRTHTDTHKSLSEFLLNTTEGWEQSKDTEERQKDGPIWPFKSHPEVIRGLVAGYAAA